MTLNLLLLFFFVESHIFIIILNVTIVSVVAPLKQPKIP
jgi:hypothetical protein